MALDGGSQCERDADLRHLRAGQRSGAVLARGQPHLRALQGRGRGDARLNERCGQDAVTPITAAE